jgi:hypothetical protein
MVRDRHHAARVGVALVQRVRQRKGNERADEYAREQSDQDAHVGSGAEIAR